MATVPSPPTIQVGGAWTSAIWNVNIRDGLNFLTGPPLCITRASAIQSISASVWTSLLFDVNEKDTDNGHSTVSNTSRYTSATPGWYDVVGTATTVTNGTGGRGVRLAKNGSPVPGRGEMSSASSVELSAVQCTGMVFLAANDYVEVQTWQSSGGPLNTAVFSDLTSYMHLRWVSK